MVISAIIIALLICFCLGLTFVLERFMGFQKLQQRTDRHDAMNALLVASGNLELGNHYGTRKALKEIQYILDGINTFSETVPVGTLVKRISQGLNFDNRLDIQIGYEVKCLRVKTNIFMLSRALTNLIKNAIEGSIEQKVVIDSPEENVLTISNRATFKDCEAVKNGLYGSRKGIGRGLGKNSTFHILKSLKFAFSYRVKGNVILAVIDFREQYDEI